MQQQQTIYLVTHAELILSLFRISHCNRVNVMLMLIRAHICHSIYHVDNKINAKIKCKNSQTAEILKPDSLDVKWIGLMWTVYECERSNEWASERMLNILSTDNLHRAHLYIYV